MLLDHFATRTAGNEISENLGSYDKMAPQQAQLAKRTTYYIMQAVFCYALLGFELQCNCNYFRMTILISLFARLQKDEIYLNLVLDYVPENVYRVARHYSKLKQTISILHVKASVIVCCASGSVLFER